MASDEDESELEDTVYQDEAVTIHTRGWKVTREGRTVRLTKTEREVLLVLLRQADDMVAYETLIAAVWGERYTGETARHHVHVQVSHLRRKLEADPQQPRYIQLIRSAGYLFRAQGPVSLVE